MESRSHQEASVSTDTHESLSLGLREGEWVENPLVLPELVAWIHYSLRAWNFPAEVKPCFSQLGPPSGSGPVG